MRSLFLSELWLFRSNDFLAYIAANLSKPRRTGLELREVHWHYPRPLQKEDTLDERAIRQLAEIGRRPILVRSFFSHLSVGSSTDF